MRPARNTDDLTREPTVEEALADPVVQAVMARDRVSRDDVLRVVRAAQAWLSASRLHASHEAVVTPFPARAVRASAAPAANRELASLGIDDEPRPARRCRGRSSACEE